MGFSLWNLFKVREKENDDVGDDSMLTLLSRIHRMHIERSPSRAVAPRLALPCLLSVHPSHLRLFSHWSFGLESGLLLTNALLILNRRRFLAKHGLDDLVQGGGGGGPQNPLKAQLAGILHAVQYLKVPVIACNLICIVFELLLGGT